MTKQLIINLDRADKMVMAGALFHALLAMACVVISIVNNSDLYLNMFLFGCVIGSAVSTVAITITALVLLFRPNRK